MSNKKEVLLTAEGFLELEAELNKLKTDKLFVGQILLI